jgi:hypothetical protein
MRERTSVRAFVRELRVRAPELIEAARGVPALLAATVRRVTGEEPAAPDAAPRFAELRAELRAEMRAVARRAGTVTLGAGLLAGGLVWLALARSPQWLGWALLAVGLAQVLYGLWR